MVTHKTDTPYKKKRKEKDNSKEKVLQLNIKDTLNLMCGLDGIIYANTINGTSNSMTFLNFFEEASHVFLPDCRPPFIYGNHIIMDNAAIHHNRAGDALGEWLDDIGCSFVYLPTYSSEMNPAEYVFNKLKTIMKRFEFRELLRENLHVAVHEALKEVTIDDMREFFKYTGYISLYQYLDIFWKLSSYSRISF